jgi:hypothetical protein
MGERCAAKVGPVGYQGSRPSLVYIGPLGLRWGGNKEL